jgi:hypothetical protein
MILLPPAVSYIHDLQKRNAGQIKRVLEHPDHGVGKAETGGGKIPVGANIPVIEF